MFSQKLIDDINEKEAELELSGLSGLTLALKPKGLKTFADRDRTRDSFWTQSRPIGIAATHAKQKKQPNVRPANTKSEMSNQASPDAAKQNRKQVDEYAAENIKAIQGLYVIKRKPGEYEDISPSRQNDQNTNLSFK